MRVKVSDLTPSQRAELDALMAMPEDEIDTSDIPEAVDPPNASEAYFSCPLNNGGRRCLSSREAIRGSPILPRGRRMYEEY